MPHRRIILKGLAALPALSALPLFGARIARGKPLSGLPENPRILIVYFSWAGSAKTVAEEIQRLTGGTLARIERTTPYPEKYEDVGKAARAEFDAGTLPEIKAGIPDVKDFDVVCIGHPIWNGRMPMPVRTFLSRTDLSGKTVLHFCTHGGSGLADTEKELAALAPKAVRPAGLAVYGWHGVRGIEKVGQWLSELGLVKGASPQAGASR